MTTSVSNAFPDGAWIAVQVRCGFEASVSKGLYERGYEEFLPSYRDPERRRAIERPLFPGYVFCRYARFPTHRIVEVPSVIRLVGIGKVPLAIPDGEIDDIRRVVDSGVYSEPWKFLHAGQHVIVTRGPIKGVRGKLVAEKKGMRLIVSVNLLGRAIAIEVDAADVRPETILDTLVVH